MCKRNGRTGAPANGTDLSRIPKPHSEFRIGNGLFSCIHFGMDDWGKRRLNSRMETLPITIPKDTSVFIQRWKNKGKCYALNCLEHYFDRFFTAFVLYNFLYEEICSNCKLELDKDCEKATKAAKKFLGASAIFADATICQNAKKIQTLIRSKTFYIRNDVWDGERIKKLDSADPEQWVIGLLEIVYRIRCNTFHGQKSFDDGQREILGPCIAVVERLNDMLIEKMHS
jgi:hypothetical protein